MLNLEFTGITSGTTTYSSWKEKTSNSDAVYAGNSAGGNNSIQLRSSNSNSGIISTTSGGKVKKITVVWESHTTDNRTLNVYGKNTAYTSPTDLYNNSNQGTLIGTIVKGSSTELTVSDEYEYIGLRSASGAMYLTKIDIEWELASSSPTCTIDPTEYDFGTVGVGQQAQKTFTVTTANLTRDLDVLLLYGEKYSVSPNTISSDATSTIVTATFSSNAVGTFEDMLVISGDGITDVGVDLTATAAWTVTASSNNDEWGTVVISDNSITATPNTGYTYAEPAYTVTPTGAATVEQVDNIFTVTPSANCNVQINFAESTTPVCTIDPTEYDFGTVGVGQQASTTFTVTTANLTGNLTVSLLGYDGSGAFSIPASSQTILQSATSTEITVNCHPSAAGELEELLVISCGGITEVNVNLTATAAPVYTVTFDPGSGTVTPASLSGVTINLSELTVTPPDGWTLYGWALDATDGATTSAPEIVSNPYTPTENVTLYAVYMKEEEGSAMITAAKKEELTGLLSESGVDSDYAQSHAPYQIKLDNTDDYIQFDATNNVATSVTINWKMIGGNSTSTLTLKGSTTVDGDFNEIETYTVSGTQNSTGTGTRNSDLSSYKKIRWYFTKGSNIGVNVSVTYSTSTTTYNSNPGIGTVATPTFSLAQESWYYSTQSLALSCSTDGATIYYTTDGTEPTASSTEYTAPISVSTTTTIKAIAYAENYDPSEIASATYNFMPNVARTCVIACKYEKKYYAMSQTANGTRLKSVEVEPNEGVVTTSANAGLLWTIENTTNGVAIRPYNTTDYLNIANQSLTITSTEDYFKVIESTNTTGTYHFQDLSSNYAIEYYSNLFTGYGLTIGGTAFEMYLLDYELSTSYTITVLNDLANGSIACELETAAENDLVTVTVTPDEGYRLATLYYYTNDPESTTTIDLETKTFNMPAANVTIGATFEAIPHLTIVLHANGNTSNWDVEQNATVELPQADAPNGYVFLGWVESDTHGLEDIIQSPHTFTANGDLYALFATISSIEYSWDLVTDASTFAEEDEFLLYGQKSDGTTNNVAGSLNGSYLDAISIDAPTNNTIQKPDGAEVFTMKAGTDGKWIFKSSEGKYLKSSNKSLSYVDNEPTEWSISINNTTGDATISGDGVLDFNSSAPRFKTYTSSQGYTAFYRKTVIVNYSNISMSVNEISGTLVTNEYNQPCYIGGPTTIPNGVTITFTAGLGNTDPANLVIEDGGQLIINNAGVQATVMKNFLEHGTYNKGEVPGWYFISSPVKDQAIQDFVDNATDGDYDLYKWVGSNKDVDEDVYKPWYNYKQHDDPNDFGSSFQTGIGYLAGYESSDEFSFVGELNYGDAYDFTPNLTYNGNIWECYALLGNPYSYALDWTDFQKSDVYDGFAIVNPAIGSYFYYSGTGIINPSQGFFVKTTGDDNLELRYNKGSHQRTQIDQIDVVVSSQNGIDNAIIRLEDESKGGFTKLENFNSENPMLWLPVNDKEYAIASYSEGTVMVPVNFKAGTTAKYTIRMKATGQYSYLHLIDRLTGDDIDMLIEGEYSFIGSPRDNAERFIVKFNNNSNSDTPENDIFAYQNGDELFVTGNGTIQVFDVTGRFVQSKEVHGNTSMSISSLPKGVYIFRLIGSEIKTQKIVVR